MSEQSSADIMAMEDRLPYQLTAGVVATKDGLRVLDAIQLNAIADLAGFAVWKQHSRLPTTPIISWPIIAERLRYRKGKPWCAPEENDIYCGSGRVDERELQNALHRLAAILCDGAEEFRMLYWCLGNLA